MSESPLPAVTATESPPHPVSIRDAFLFWLKLGFISFGGPPGKYPSCIRNWWKTDAGSQSNVFCMHLIIAWYYPDLRHNSWQRISAG